MKDNAYLVQPRFWINHQTFPDRFDVQIWNNFEDRGLSSGGWSNILCHFWTIVVREFFPNWRWAVCFNICILAQGLLQSSRTRSQAGNDSTRLASPPRTTNLSGLVLGWIEVDVAYEYWITHFICNIFQSLQDLRTSAPLQTQHLQNFALCLLIFYKLSFGFLDFGKLSEFSLN